MDDVIIGTWECEGHNVSFDASGDGIVRITESNQKNYERDWNSHRLTPIKEAIEYQNQFIKLGYDKIS